MGVPETVLLQHQRQQPPAPVPSRSQHASKLLLLTFILSLVGYMSGGKIDMISSKPPADKSSPTLKLRQVYMQSTPKPPPTLVALSTQGTHAGKVALRDWYDDQAQMAKDRGYAFPFRLSRWQQPEGEMAVAEAAEQYSVQFEGQSAEQQQQQSEFMLMEQASEKGVRATGTGAMLARLRAQYLRSAHGRQYSYWSATPHRFTATNTTQDPEDPEEPKNPDEPKEPGEEPHEPAPATQWNYFVEDGLRVPNITHKPTLASIARMVANAYQPTTSDTWEHLGDPWRTHDSFGWQSDGLRGHVFADESNTTVIISLKGTSSTFFLGGGSETSARDKYNDNRLFSCCCAYVDFTWSTVCDCHLGGNKCNMTCLQESMGDETSDNYFYAAAQIFMDVVRQYPEANIIFSGHSLGGSLSSLLGLTFGLPSIAMEAPGDRLASERLHLPRPPSAIMQRLPLFHVGNTADPVFMGMCSGRTSSCYYAGYAMESRCHNGRQLVFDTVLRRDWRMDIRHHRINEVIYLVIEPWGNLDPEEKFPELRLEDPECADCGLWKFMDNDSPQ
ncbi:putative lipase atg15 [Kickxella alabastrina]|nr:putative lipase atg15 [Kickxella alabastrina]